MPEPHPPSPESDALPAFNPSHEWLRQEAWLKTGALQSAILTSANFSIIATDEKGIIQLFNVGAERKLGYLAAEVVNKIKPSDIQEPSEVIARAQALSAELGTTIAPGFEALAFKASRGIEDIYELTYICKDRSSFPAIASITALRNEYEDIIGYLLIATDNSVRKQVEANLKLAMAAAEKANLAKSDFLSGMSHELRTPLSAILGFAQLIESGMPPPTVSQKRSLDQILNAGWYLLKLINEILDLALIESGQLSLSPEPVALREVLQECETMCEPQAAKRSVQMHFPLISPHYCVRADRTRVKQVVINLLSNAIKYNRIGGRVTLTCTALSAERIRICIEDTGEGLTAEQLAKLFQPFNRLGQEASAEEGTGIGLVMTKRLVELMARRPDIRLLSAPDGMQGIAMARELQPDVILMDINLPGLSGIKAMKILADDPTTAHIMVIALSANAIPRDIERGLEAGFFRYLTKPIKVDEFMDTLDISLRVAKTRKGVNNKEIPEETP